MSNPWFRLYAEFAHDPKVQMLAEAMQRRYVMLMCLRCSNALVTLHETELAFYLRISESDLAETKALFVAKGFINETWELLNWDKRQFASDSSAARVAKHRALSKEKQMHVGNVDVTLPKRASNAPDTDTDTDSEHIGAKAPSSPAKLPDCPTQEVIDLYHQMLPVLPRVRLTSPKRTKAIASLWKFTLTTKTPEGLPRATDAKSALVWIQNYFALATKNDFLMGRTQRGAEHANWQCDLDFLLSEKGMRHVIEKTRTA